VPACAAARRRRLPVGSECSVSPPKFALRPFLWSLCHCLLFVLILPSDPAYSTAGVHNNALVLVRPIGTTYPRVSFDPCLLYIR